jgi:uncharacterized protein (DUF488 family)
VLYTIGHGARPQQELIEALRSFGVTSLADVRRYPRSRANPQFNQVALSVALPNCSIEYHHWETLGGRRTGTGAQSPNAGWRHPAFRAYADFMMEAAFWETLDRLLRGARENTTSVMCSETLWWRCHRRLIADAAVARGFCVLHIMRLGTVAAHVLSPPARIVGDRVTYADSPS